MLLCLAWSVPLCGQTAASDGASRLFQKGSADFAAGRLPAAKADFAALVHQFPRIAAAHTALGTVLLAQGEASAAVAELETAHRLDPKDTRTLLTLAVAQKSAGQYAASVDSFRAASAQGAALSADESLAYGVVLSATGAPAEAQRVLQAAADTAATPALLDAWGTVLAQGGDLPQAEQRLEQALTADASYAPAHAHLGSVLLALNQPAPAASELKKAMDLGDASPVTVSQFGRALVTLGRPEEAIAALQPVAERNSAALNVTYTLALAQQAQGNVADALPLFRKVAAAQPNNAEALTNYGLVLVQTGDAAGGLRQYQQALTHGDSALLRQNMGVAYLQQNDVDNALAQFRAGLKLAPDDVQMHYDLGLALKLKDDVPGATAELLKTEQLDPQLPDAPYTLGVLEMQQGHFAEAAAQLRQAVTLQPGNGEAWSLLGSVYRQAGDSAKAQEALRHAVELQPASPGPHITLAAVLAENGDRAGAAAERKTAADLSRAAVSQQRATFALRSGRSLLTQGKAAEALVQMQNAVTAAPESADAHRGLADALQQTGQSKEANAEREKAGKLESSAHQQPGK